MPHPIVIVQFVAGTLGVLAGLVAAAGLVGSLRREGGRSGTATVLIGLLSLAAILVGGAVLAALVAGRQPDGPVFAALAVVLGTLATVFQRRTGGPLPT